MFARAGFVTACALAAVGALVWATIFFTPLLNMEPISLSAGASLLLRLPVLAACFAATGYFLERYARRDFVQRTLLAAEREKSDRLLLNVLPAPIAERLKAGEDPIADAFADATVVFADLVGSTPLAASTTPEAFVAMLNELFSAFNALALRHGVEMTRAIGDGYMAVVGAPTARLDHAEAAAELALGMRAAVASCRAPDGASLRMRFGINTGPLLAAVVGTTKFSYDAWGDAVNTAARMESHGLPGAIQVSEEVQRRLRDAYDFEARGVIDVKGKGPMPVYFLLGRRAAEDPGSAPATVMRSAG